MANRPTLTDVANRAGLSVSTVDRVINGRETVRAETAKRVHDAASEIGYHGTGLIRQRLLADLPRCRFGFLLLKEQQDFYRHLSAALDEAVQGCRQVRGETKCLFATSQQPEEQAQLLLELGKTSDVVAATTVNHPLVTDAVRALKTKGIPVYAMLNDFAPGVRVAYLGLDNLRVGRIAGWAVSKLARLPGPVAVFVGGHRWHGHELREMGFRSYLREHASDFRVLDTVVNLETRQVTHETTLDLLHRHDDLQAIFVAGGGMEGAISALREERRPAEIVLVVNELTDMSRAALRDGYVSLISATPVQELCTQLVRMQVRSFLAEAEGGGADAGENIMQPRILVPESV